jgi:hypothetical protein
MKYSRKSPKKHPILQGARNPLIYRGLTEIPLTYYGGVGGDGVCVVCVCGMGGWCGGGMGDIGDGIVVSPFFSFRSPLVTQPLLPHHILPAKNSLNITSNQM